MIDRREFLVAGAAATAALPAVVKGGAASPSTGRFRLNYAPHLGTFRNLGGDDPVDQIDFAADAGFRGLEEINLRQRSTAQQRQIARRMDRRGMTLGPIAGSIDFRRPTFASGRRESQAGVLRDVRESLDLAERTNAIGIIVAPGRRDERLPPAAQRANAVELLNRCAELCERQGRMLLLEPLRDCRLFLQSPTDAARLCRAVDSPACRMLLDVADRPAPAALLIAQINRCWDEIGYFQLGDRPGRKEPGTGTIDFRRIFRHIAERGYTGLLGMDHGNLRPGEEGEQRVIEAYIKHDPATNSQSLIASSI